MVLIIGTITAISPSFITGANAQTQPYYGYDSYESEYADKKDSSYEPRYETDNNNYKKSYGEDIYGPEYPSKYTDSNSYEPTTPSYGNDNNDNRKSYKTNSYEPITPSYGNENNYQKTYGKDNIYDKSQYQSYKPDYKPKYPSYEKDDRDKSKDSKFDINKIKCINNNVNINGNNIGDINVGNKGQAAYAEEGYLGAYSSGGSGYSGERYYDGYNKQDKGFECIINNNNTNINIAGGGNQTELLTCEECFTTNLNETQLENLTDVLSSRPDIADLEGLCELLSNATITNEIKLLALIVLFNEAGITDENILRKVLACLADLKLITLPPQGLPSMR